MAKAKFKNLAQVQMNDQQNQKPVFTNNPFQKGIVQNNELANNTDDYKYSAVELGSIKMDEEVEYSNALFKSVEERMVSPLILIYDYVEKSKAGRKYREKTGFYRVVDGKKRVSIYKRLFDEKQSLEEKQKYSKIQALILPLNVPEDEVESIRAKANENKQDGVQNVIRDVTETLNEAITYCYRYEAIEVEVDKLVEKKDNKFHILQSEVDALEQSIYNFGLMQPILVLPVMDEKTLSVHYEIESGHKRTKAIRQLIAHAKEGKYGDNVDIILERFKTVPALLIPMGAEPKHIEKIYLDTNVLSRHMQASDMYEHIDYFEDLPSRPKTKESYLSFTEKGYQIKELSKIVQQHMKDLGFPGWKSTKTSLFLNAYYYGSEKALETFKNIENSKLTQKELNWIITKYKDFSERPEQDRIIAEAELDKTSLLKLMETGVERRKQSSISVKKITENIMKQNMAVAKMTETAIEATTKKRDIKSAKKALEDLEKSISELKSKLEELETK